ncbi:uncharacterized protein BCR38DRAFT_331935 [Pseudomassariella vexata]|uniref:F-box domain-containing protein n=1 Tax=Pseudomassariella vexata TaxID=1141098 RepID=A0A1Y2EIM7_9PEZI|nr:uncharacterized protein BCR38DRAFT_331935 [Pseudomassariella vexata]ORY71287.1 hypothetical protein BCR38DRAFT_331935 [Pseudomassariella vexata]
MGAAHNAVRGDYNGWGGYGKGGFAPWLELPTPLLQRVFAFVCPHSQDESYETCEQSAIEDSCMLCDLRDLAHAGMVCGRWRKTAVKIMYHSIRIDAVHYCEREIYLSEKRKRRSRFDRNGIPEDTASARLHLLCRTLRDDPTRLGALVKYLKTPYMLRESNTSELARTIAVLPNLRYVDLPEGLFMDDSGYGTLRLEVEARCHNLRKMTYMGGSERSLEALTMGTVWPNLEVLELSKINIDPTILRHVLAVLQHLRALKVTESKVIDDDIFKNNDMLPAFPALEELILKGTPRVTAGGLAAYLSRPDTRQSLKVLSLIETGVQPQALQTVMAGASKLEALSIVEQVNSAFNSHSSPIQPLANPSLKTLRYEITASDTANPYTGMTQGYYTYLAQSLFGGGFPSLTALYVRDQNFPDLLLGLPPPMPGYGGNMNRPSSSSSMGMFSMGSNGGLGPNSTGGGANPWFSSNNPFATPRHYGASGNGLGPSMLALNQTLEVFTKGEDDLDWGIVKMDPYDSPGYAGGRGVGGSGRHARSGSTTSITRPLSSYGLADTGAGWREGPGGARKSVMVGNGAGGFLAVPNEGAGGPRRGSTGQTDEWPRPRSSGGPKAERDLWR